MSQSPTTTTPQLAQAVAPVGRALPTETVQKLQRAAAGSQTPFATLVSIASAESNFNAAAQNKRSSATGAFQITDNTWMHLVKKYGPADLAGKVKQDASGVLSVAPENRAAVMGARKDLDLSARLAARYCDECRAGLTRKLGRSPSETEVRMGYFLGVTGATRLINAAATTPDASIKSVSPGAYASNRSIFTAHGKPLTASQALAALERKFDAEIARGGGAPASPPTPTSNSLIFAQQTTQFDIG